jgi:hypothetical protein
MMGQQQTVAASTFLRRMVLALAIAAVMALLVMASAAPAFAASGKAKGASASLEADQVAYNTMANNLNNFDNPGRGGREVTAKYAKDNQGIDDIAH